MKVALLNGDSRWDNFDDKPNGDCPVSFQPFDVAFRYDLTDAISRPHTWTMDDKQEGAVVEKTVVKKAWVRPSERFGTS